MEISIIIVNFKSRDFLQKCLASIENIVIKQYLSKKIEVVIFNNDPKKLRVDKNYPFFVKTIDYGKNIGFGAANNLAVKNAQGKILFFLNPDTELLTGPFGKILENYKKNDSLGAVGFKIIEKKNNRPQPWTSGKKTNLWNIFFRNTWNKPWNKKEITKVDWVSGTAFLIKKNIFNEVGGFDENFFMYFEDQDLCLRIKKLNKKNIFLPFFQVIHFDGKSWNGDNKKKKKYYRESQRYFFEKHNNSFQTFLIKKFHSLLNIFN